MLDPKTLGAASSLDVGVFLFAGGLGGIIDAITGIAGFAEPAVFGGLCGAGALGLKHLIVAWTKPSRPPPPDRES